MFVICIKDRLLDRHLCLNLYPCVIKVQSVSQSVSLSLSLSLSYHHSKANCGRSGTVTRPLPNARSVAGQKRLAADQPFSFSLHRLPPSSCSSRPVNGLNSTDFCLPWCGRKTSDTFQFLGLTDGTASEHSAHASFPHTVTDFLAFKNYHCFMSAHITFNSVRKCSFGTHNFPIHPHLHAKFRDNRPSG